MLTDPEEAGARVLAARGYARLTREQLAQRCSLTSRQLQWLEDGKRSNTTEAELLEIADACGASRVFMLHGWEGMDTLATEFIARTTALLGKSDELRDATNTGG